MFFGLSLPGTGEWVLILAIALVLFGGDRVPEFARLLGKGIREFKRAMNEGLNSESDEDDQGKTDGTPR